MYDCTDLHVHAVHTAHCIIAGKNFETAETSESGIARGEFKFQGRKVAAIKRYEHVDVRLRLDRRGVSQHPADFEIYRAWHGTSRVFRSPAGLGCVR